MAKETPPSNANMKQNSNVLRVLLCYESGEQIFTRYMYIVLVVVHVRINKVSKIISHMYVGTGTEWYSTCVNLRYKLGLPTTHAIKYVLM